MTTLDSTRPSTDVDPLVLAVPASAGQRAASIVVDAAVPLTTLTAAVIAFAGGRNAIAWTLVAAAAVALVATATARARTGRSAGHLAAGLRTVSLRTGAPAVPPEQRATFDVRRGRDPVSPALAPFAFPADAPASATEAIALPARVPVVELDSGQKLSLSNGLVIGRNPSPSAGSDDDVFQWSDLSRTLSKSHTRLEWDGRLAWVTDLGSTNGTFLRVGDASQPLLPLQRTPLPTPATLELGDRVATVTVPS